MTPEELHHTEPTPTRVEEGAATLDKLPDDIQDFLMTSQNATWEGSPITVERNKNGNVYLNFLTIKGGAQYSCLMEVAQGDTKPDMRIITHYPVANRATPKASGLDASPMAGAD